MNYQMELFYQQLIDLINNCELPVGSAYFILKDCLNIVEKGYRQAILEDDREWQDGQTTLKNGEIKGENDVT